MSEFYRHSGQAPMTGIITSIAATLSTAVVLGFVYAYLQNWIPFIYVHFLFTGAFGWAIGYVMGSTSRFGHIRNRAVSAAILFFGVLAGYYVAWGADMLARVGMENFDAWWMAFEPEVLLAYIQVFYDEGFWTLGKDANAGTVSGLFLGAVWLAELSLIGITAWLGSGIQDTQAKHVYCESCRRWMRSQAGVVRRKSVTDQTAIDAFAQGNPLPILRADQPHPVESNWYDVDLTTCDGCEDSIYASVMQCARHGRCEWKKQSGTKAGRAVAEDRQNRPRCVYDDQPNRKQAPIAKPDDDCGSPARNVLGRCLWRGLKRRQVGRVAPTIGANRINGARE